MMATQLGCARMRVWGFSGMAVISSKCMMHPYTAEHELSGFQDFLQPLIFQNPVFSDETPSFLTDPTKSRAVGSSGIDWLVYPKII